MEGNWLKSIKVINQNDKSEKVLWTYISSDSENNYYYQPYTFDLNNLTDELRKALPPTDSRFRPDQRIMENQNIDKAAEEKMRLEEKQRQKRKENEKKGITVHKPMYFEETYDDLTGELIYRYNGKYFEDRKNRNFAHFPDIF
jgi:nitrate reductase beta subunit